MLARMARFELSDGHSHKFWAIERTGARLSLRWGKIGTDGRKLEKSFASPALAEEEEKRLVGEKTKRGYAPIGKAPPTSTEHRGVGRKAKPTSKPVDERALATPIGRVSAESSFLALVVVDGAFAGAYRHPFGEGGLDFDDTMNGPLPVGKGSGLIVDCASSGIADVYRFGDALVVPDIAVGDDEVDTDQAMLHAIAGHPTTKAKRIGVVEVPSGVLVLMGQHEDGPKLDVAKVARQAKPVRTRSGVAIPVPPGRYEVWREAFRDPPAGEWGEMAARVRVVPTGTKVTLGKPLVELAPLGKSVATQSAHAIRHLYVDPKLKGWTHARTLSVGADGMVFAGQDDGNALTAWHASGERAWQQTLAKKAHEVMLQRVGADLLVLPALAQELLVLDPATGKKRRSLKIPVAGHFRVLGDRLFVLHHEETRIFRYPAMKALATLKEHRDSYECDVSPDGRWIATSSSDQAHLYDAKTFRHLRSIEGDVCALAFDTKSRLLLASRQSAVRVVDPKTGRSIAKFDAAPERARKPQVQAIVCTSKFLAISRVDGTTLLLHPKTMKPLARFDKHTTQSYFGPPVTFSPDGTTLWIGACPRGMPAGVSSYDVTRFG